MATKKSTTGQSFPYIYAQIDDYNASYPVMEHIHPSHAHTDGNTNTDPNQESEAPLPLNRPDFLFSNSTTADTYRVVEFYVHWCDVCKHFKPRYIQLGQRIQELLSLPQSPDGSGNTTKLPKVEMYAVSCAPNRDLCRYLQIDQYPFFRIYRPDDCSNKSRCDTDGMDIPHAQINPTIILQQMGIAMQQQQQSFIDDDGDKVVKSQGQYGMWTWGMQRFPWWWLVGQTMTSTNRNDDASNNNIMKKYEMIRSREELRDDIHTSFDYAMRYAVYTRASDNDDDDASLSAERAATLYEWLHLLRKTLPISYTTLHQCIKSLIDHHDYVKRSELYMISILDEYAPPKHAVWSTSCSYGMMDTGYTCGLWLLLHTITVGVVDYNRNVAFPQHRLSTETVAVTIRNYINTFFGCEICRQNFVSTFDSCGHDRCHRLHSDISHNEHDWIQLPLWLLETHNAVNVRLLQEQGQRDNTTVFDNDVISVIWPLSRDCPKCWLNANGSTPTTIPINKRNDDIMYKFLKVVYGQQDALYIKYQEQIQADVKEVMSTERSNAPVTNNNDVNFNTTGNSKLLDHIVAAMPSLQFHLGMIPMLDSREVATHRFIVRELMEKVFVNNNGDDPKLLDQSVTNTKSTALMEWLMLLRKTLPVVWHGVHSLIDELLNNWSYVCKSKDYLFAIVSEHPPPSNDIKKGFILPLLLEISNDDEAMDYLDVLHIISVGVVQYNKYMVSSDDQRLSTFNVIDTIRKYTSQVFDGSSIESTEAQHTVQESMDDVCENDSICDTFSESPKNEQDWISLPMWTVKVHNTVLQQRETTTANHRLLSLVAARKHLFPRSVECPKCWIYDGSLRWDDDYVYKYLLLLYGPESTLGVGLRFEFFGPPLWETFVGALQNSLKHLTLPIFQPDKYKLH